MENADLLYRIACVIVGAAVFLFLLFRSLKKSEDPHKLIFRWVLTFALAGGGIYATRWFPPQGTPPVVAFFAIIIGAMWTKSIGSFIAAPLTGMFTGGSQEVDPAPLYSIAMSKRGLSQFDEAIRLIREQLEKHPGDFTGMMLIAAIQAENLNDIPSAQITLEQLLAVPNLPPQGAAAALHTMADFHLRLPDPESARAALQRIVDKFPDTPMAQTATQRIARIGTLDQIVAARDHGPVTLRPGLKDIGLRTDLGAVAVESPMKIASEYTQQLTRHPADAETREKLAMLYMTDFMRPDLAAAQFQLLADMPNMPARRVGGWLNQLATLHLHNNNLEAAQAAVRAIIERFPASAPADMARARLPALEGELRGLRGGQSVKMGSYDHDLGLGRTRI